MNDETNEPLAHGESPCPPGRDGQLRGAPDRQRGNLALAVAAGDTATPEPLSAILADFRADIPAMTSGELPHPTPEYLRILLDRIEAAAKYSDAMCRKNEEAAFLRGQQTAPDYYFAALREFNAEMRKALEGMRQGCANIGYTASQVLERADDYVAHLREALAAPAEGKEVSNG